MLAKSDPREVYQRVEFDARVNGAAPSELVHVCFDQLILALSTAILAEERQDPQLKSRSLTRALTSIMALQLGIDHGQEMAGVLTQFYGSARKSILASSVDFDAATLRTMRDDFGEIRAALVGSAFELAGAIS